MTGKKPTTPELCRAALSHIPASLPRDEWARVAMSLKSQFPNETGFDLFDQWSQTDPNHYNAHGTKSTWRSVKAGGPVGIATLFHLAKAHGFTMPTSGQDATHAPPATPEDLARLAAQRAQRLREEQAATEAAHNAAATEAARQWDAATTDGKSPYLDRKNVQPHGVRFAPGGWLLVPMRDGEGRLWNVQRIAPNKPDSGPEKLFCKGGRKSGLWHMVGVPEATPGQPVAALALVLLAEGYATAATLHEATGLPVAVCFDAGNLLHVARALRALWPAARLVVCGDDDRETEAQKGHNPGRTKATAAAQAVGGVAVFPSDLPPGGTDFNDLHAHHGGAAGLAVVRAQVRAALDSSIADEHPADRPATAPPEAPGKRATKQRPSKRQPDSEAPAQHSEPHEEWDGFSLTENGVFYSGLDRDGKRTSPQWVCSPLRVEAATRDQSGDGWGYLLTFSDPVGKQKQWAMPARMLAGDGNEFRGILLAMGLRLSSNQRMRHLLSQYIQTRQPDEFASCTDRVGWHGRAFVLPHETIGDVDERIVFQSESAMENTFKQRGTLDAWRDRVAALCAGNSRLVFPVSASFAAALMHLINMESGGFHYRGGSSSGKTTALEVACSVFGGPDFMQRWRATDNALESIAAQHCDGPLVLDEIAQVDAKALGEIVYMLGNGMSKARATRNGTPRARLRWRLMFFSSGELSMSAHMEEGQKRARAGQDVRMADICMDAGAGMDGFENIHGAESPSAFSDSLKRECKSVYGTAGRAWLEWVTQNADSLKARIKHEMAAVAGQMIPESAGGQVFRVGQRFALVAVAGELATQAGLTGWEPGESERAARACFNAWLAARGGTGNGEVTAMLRQVRKFLEAHGQGRFTQWHRATDDHAGKTLHRAGFARLVNEKGEPTRNSTKPDYGGEWSGRVIEQDVRTEYFILAEVFRGEVCQGFDPVAVCRVLLDHACLMPDKGRPFDCKPRLPGVGPTRCYRILPAIFDLEA